MKRILLFTTLGCHLCEEAEAIALAVCHPLGVVVEPVEISEDDALVERYGLRIPVMGFEGSPAELCWPFDNTVLKEWLQQNAGIFS